MSIFEEVKAIVSARDVAQHYGVKVNRNGMACCPFHADKHPSMKVDQVHYHCFGCGAHGDAIDFVARTFGIGQYEAACKINEDFNLGINTGHRLTSSERSEINNCVLAGYPLHGIGRRSKRLFPHQWEGGEPYCRKC